MEQINDWLTDFNMGEKWTGFGEWGRGLYQTLQEDPKKAMLIIGLIVIGIIILTLFLRSIALVFEWIKTRRIERKGVVLKILAKKSTSAKQTEALIRNIHSLVLNTKLRAFMQGRPYVSFEIAAEKDRITFYIWVPNDYKDVLKERIYATYPECAIHQVDDYLDERIWTMPIDYFRYIRNRIKKEKVKFPKNHQSVYGTEMELAFHHVLNLNKQLDREDIISSIVSSMNNLEWHEKVVMQVLIRPLDGRWQQAGQRVLKEYVADGRRPNKKGRKMNSNFAEKMADELEEVIDNELSEFEMTKNRKKSTASRKTPYERKEITGATEKILDAGFETVIRLATIGNFRKGAKTRLKVLGAAFNELDKENKLKRKIILSKQYFYRRLKKRRMYLVDPHNILTPGELSKFFMRLPDEDLVDRYPEIEALVVKEFSPPRNVETEKFLIGMNVYRGKETTIGMKPKDIVRHIIAQGSTGSGKSEWAKTLMKQQMDLGLGFALFEPHGKLAVETLQFIPEHRRKDVIVFDIFDDYPPAFNFCKVREEKGRKTEEIIEKTAKEIIDMNKRLFAEAWSGKNAYYLENAIKTVIEMKGGNYVDIRRLFHDHEYRQYAINNIRDPQLKHFWREEFKQDKKGNLSPGTQSTVNSVDYKLGSFLNTKSLLRAVGQDDCIDFREILNQNKILIFRFDKQRMSEDQLSFLGGIAIKMLIVESFSRDRSQWLNPFLIFMDEFQNFMSPNIETILDELRKYGIGLVAMHQRLSQLDKIKGLKDAIYNNVGTTLSFTCGKPDAPYFEDIFKPRIDADDMVRLPSRYGYLKLLVDGQKSETFNIYTLDSPHVDKKEALKSYNEIMAMNRKGKLHYKEIDKLIADRIVGGIDDIEEDHYEVVEQGGFVEGWDDIDVDQVITNETENEYDEYSEEEEVDIEEEDPDDLEYQDQVEKVDYGSKKKQTAEQQQEIIMNEIENNQEDLFNKPEYNVQEEEKGNINADIEPFEGFEFDDDYEKAIGEDLIEKKLTQEQSYNKQTVAADTSSSWDEYE